VEGAALLVVELIEQIGFPGKILARSLCIALVSIVDEEEEIDTVHVLGMMGRRAIRSSV